jgi:hypothetical protein
MLMAFAGQNNCNDINNMLPLMFMMNQKWE